jgi:pimeloyl-ACP methyl ester carboxylesterase
VVRAHAGQFNKESWDTQAHALVAAGFEVLALDFRGYGKSNGPGNSDPISAPLYVDVLSGVRFLRRRGAKDRVGCWSQHGRMGGSRRADCFATA